MLGKVYSYTRSTQHKIYAKHMKLPIFILFRPILCCTAGLPFIGPGHHTMPPYFTGTQPFEETSAILASGAWSRLNQLMKRGSDEQIGSKFGHTMSPHTTFREKYRRSSDAHFLCMTACTQKVSHFPRHLSRICSFQLTDRVGGLCV